MAESSLNMRFGGETGLSDGLGNLIAGGPRFAIAPGPALVRIDWGAPDFLDGTLSPATYIPGPIDETLIDWVYADGHYAIRAVAAFPGGARDVEHLTATLDVTALDGQSRMGTGLRDFMMAGHGGDTLAGGGADDWLEGRDGADLLIGGGGNDWLWGGDADGAADTMIGGAGDDSMAGYEGDDQLRGDAGDDALFGHGGQDRLVAGVGADQLTGGAGRDTLLCGVDTDSDWVYYYDLADGGDRIADFTAGIDRIALTFLRGLGVDATRFVGSAAAMTDAGAWIIYNAATGRLQVDLNGTDGGERTDIAVLAGAPALTFGDLLGF